MILWINPSIPPILRSWMISRRTRLSRLSINILPIRALGHSIVVPEESATAQFGKEEVDDFFKGAGFYGVGLDSSQLGLV